MTEKQDPPSTVYIAFGNTLYKGIKVTQSIRHWTADAEQARMFEQETGAPSHEYQLAGAKGTGGGPGRGFANVGGDIRSSPVTVIPAQPESAAVAVPHPLAGNAEWQVTMAHQDLDRMDIPRDDGESNYSVWGHFSLAFERIAKLRIKIPYTEPGKPVTYEPVAAPADVAVPSGWVAVTSDRSYDQRAKALIAFNTAEKNGKDRDDALQAAWDAMLAAAPKPPVAAQKPPGIDALTCVIASLRDTAHFQDEEGELTNDLRALRDWAMLAASPQPPVAAQEPNDPLLDPAPQAAVAQADADQLHGAANWLLDALDDCNTADLQSHLRIGFNRAERLMKAALAARAQDKEQP